MTKKHSIPQLLGDTFLIDSHCHLDMDAYQEDLPEILDRAAENSVRTIISIGIDEHSSDQAISLARQYPIIKATVGVHPHEASTITNDTLDCLASLIDRNREFVVGYGEIGLDYAKMYSPLATQQTQFRSQLSLAKSLKLPVIIHDRDAHHDTLQILREAGPFDSGGVMHCFSGDMALAKQVLDLGFHISIPGVVSFKNGAILQKVAREIPLSCMLLETDGPFLTPTPFRGKRNEPAYIPFIAEKVAELRKISIAEVATATSSNAITLFGLTKHD